MSLCAAKNTEKNLTLNALGKKPQKKGPLMGPVLFKARYLTALKQAGCFTLLTLNQSPSRLAYPT